MLFHLVMLLSFALTLTALILAYTLRKENMTFHILTLVFILLGIIIPGALLFKTFCVQDDELYDYDKRVYEKE